MGSQALLTWWARDGRHDLPWRQTRDPWAVLVSELMLQQTQVPRVVGRFGPFVARFPTPAACAAASVGAVVEAWSGLGYNRRAVNLHRCAVAVVERHGGVVPDSLDDLLGLPGIGPYTARAVLVFAYGRDIGLIDTTAGRVIARAIAGRPLTVTEAQVAADEAVPSGKGWEWGQAVFDLGALVCTKRAPACDRCPVRTSCAWAGAGFPEPDPVVGSAGISRPQSRFEGSFRQRRAAVVRALIDGPVVAEPAVAASLVRDGLALWSDDGSSLRLP